jgi:predicted PurR-regulated permease PerM
MFPRQHVSHSDENRRKMKRSRAIALVVLLAAIAVAAFFALRPGELVYQGQSVSAWIADLGSNDIQRMERAHKTLVAMGEPAMPYLAKTIETKESKFHSRLHDENEAVRENAVEAVRKIDPAAVEKAGVN